MGYKINELVAGRYILISKIGRGGYSEVWLAKDLFMDSFEVALKVYAPDKGLDESGLNLFKKEYSLMMGLNHPNLLRATYFDVFQESPFLVLPLCNNGSLGSKLRKGQVFDETELAKVLLQLSEALDYLHSKGIVHQDIKPDNILISDEGNYLLSDFGISIKMRSTLQNSATIYSSSLTLAYAAPEKFSNSLAQNPASDIFSIGVMIYEMCTGIVPWNGAGGSIVKDDSLIPVLPDVFHQNLSGLLRSCLAFDPAKRPNPKFIQGSANSFLEKGKWLTPASLPKKSGVRVTEKLKFEKSNKPKAEIKSTKKVNREIVESTEPKNFLEPKYIYFGVSLSVVLLVLVLFIPNWKESPAEDKFFTNIDSTIFTPVEVENEEIAAIDTSFLITVNEPVPKANPTQPVNKLQNNSPSSIQTKIKSTVIKLDNIEIRGEFGNYHGEVKNQVPHGKGQMTWQNGDVYEGFFESGILSGAGTFTWQNGDRYIGSFQRGQPNGQGVLTTKDSFVENCPGCVKYNGSWKDGKKEGDGRCYDAKGETVFEGKFLLDKPVR